jgi:Uma2 family endonuclease
MQPSIANPLAILKPKLPPRLFSLQEYLQKEEKAIERHEYFNGKIVKTPMAKGPHNIIAANILTAIKNGVKSLDKKFIVFGSNQKIYLPQFNFGLYPDALVVAEQPLYWDDNQVLLINPILIVEILSKSTGAYDRGDKFTEYKSLDSFKEYVLIEQNRFWIETRFREESNLWRDTFNTALNSQINIRSLGFSIDMSDIYENVVFEDRGKKASKKS